MKTASLFKRLQEQMTLPPRQRDPAFFDELSSAWNACARSAGKSVGQPPNLKALDDALRSALRAELSAYVPEPMPTAAESGTSARALFSALAEGMALYQARRPRRTQRGGRPAPAQGGAYRPEQATSGDLTPLNEQQLAALMKKVQRSRRKSAAKAPAGGGRIRSRARRIRKRKA